MKTKKTKENPKNVVLDYVVLLEKERQDAKTAYAYATLNGKYIAALELLNLLK